LYPLGASCVLEDSFSNRLLKGIIGEEIVPLIPQSAVVRVADKRHRKKKCCVFDNNLDLPLY
jgi:hypothetical protein